MNAAWFQSQLTYHYWANKRLLAVMDDLTAEQYSRDLGSSFPSLQATVAHMLHAETIWLSRFLGAPVAGVQADDVPTPGAARQRWAELEQQLLKFINGLDQVGVDRVLTVKTSTGQEFRHPLWEALQHLVNHGTYHRGQLTTMLRQVGASPLSTDLITYYRERSGQ
jgi:uncharacterized damage-inducible protein DinB